MPPPASMSLRALVVCADDYGLNAPVSEGIVRLAGQGRLTATSAMVLSPRWADDAQRLALLRDRLDVGLHLDWTSEFALQAGHGKPLSHLMAAAVCGRIRPADVRGEVERQLDAFERAWGAPPDHVDGHQHVHQFAGLREALVQALAEAPQQRGWGAHRPWLRISRPVGPGAGAKGRLIAALGASRLERLARQAGLPCARTLTGVYDFSGGIQRYATLLSQWLAQAPDGAVLMCHPAQGRGADDGIAAAREREFEVLSGPALSRAPVRLRRGSALFAAA